jgi:hypothetical protein
MGGAADMDGRAAQPETGANDPNVWSGRAVQQAAGCEGSRIHPLTDPR